VIDRDAWLRRRSRLRPLGMVIFDCDGVLIDSETICNRVVAADLTAMGWPMTTEECEARFIGQSFHDMQPLIEATLGRSLGAGWVEDMVVRISAVMAHEAEAMPGAPEALHATTALGLPWRIASNSSHMEMAAKFGRTGLADLVAGRTHSADEIIQAGGRGKPAPDVFLAAALAEGIDPADCLVIEDSVHGIHAALAAGMDCLGLGAAHREVELRAAGAIPFRSMHDLPALLRLALEHHA
jgi:beta-phosphoglucomutase-like phosphatase (HAD superfamily)